MFKNAPSFHDAQIEKLILHPGPDLDHSQNLTDWTLAEGLSFHKIWFKSVDNFQ